MATKLLFCRPCNIHTSHTRNQSKTAWVCWCGAEVPAAEVVDFSDEIRTIGNLIDQTKFVPAAERQARKDAQK